uniref:Uncharacterized protein n=1 Tax=Arundo donax TaxID=35708 RepID=A0A0A9A5T1_ARUDO
MAPSYASVTFRRGSCQFTAVACTAGTTPDTPMPTNSSARWARYRAALRRGDMSAYTVATPAAVIADRYTTCQCGSHWKM